MFLDTVSAHEHVRSLQGGEWEKRGRVPGSLAIILMEYRWNACRIDVRRMISLHRARDSEISSVPLKLESRVLPYFLSSSWVRGISNKAAAQLFVVALVRFRLCHALGAR